MRIGLIPDAHCSVNFLGIQSDKDEFGDAMSEEQRGDGVRLINNIIFFVTNDDKILLTRQFTDFVCVCCQIRQDAHKVEEQ